MKTELAGQPWEGRMISVVIPTLNEMGPLPATLDALMKAAGEVAHEIIVVDGGSTDGTVERAGDAGCRLVRSPRAQRAAQMNEGAAHANGEVLLFLHADTLLPPDTFGQVQAACGRPGVVGGGFARRYDSPSRWLRFTCWLARWRNRWFGWHLGDQAIFVRRPIFERLGGYRDFDVFEDVDFSRRLAGEGKLVTLESPVLSSARRFGEYGTFCRSLADAWLMGRYLLGASPHRLDKARVKPASLSRPGLPIVPAVEALWGDAQNVKKQERGVR